MWQKAPPSPPASACQQWLGVGQGWEGTTIPAGETRVVKIVVKGGRRRSFQQLAHRAHRSAWPCPPLPAPPQAASCTPCGPERWLVWTPRALAFSAVGRRLPPAQPLP